MVLSLSLFLRIFGNRLVAGSRSCCFSNNEAFISSISNTVICAFVLSANISSIGRWMLTMSVIGHIRFRNVGLFLDSNVLLDNTCLALFERTPCFFRKKTWMCCDRRWELLHEGFFKRLGVRLKSKIKSACHLLVENSDVVAYLLLLGECLLEVGSDFLHHVCFRCLWLNLPPCLLES